jgi:eukaryotic-like serine/threonine-protein kinase
MGRVWVASDTAAPALRFVALKTALHEAANNREFWATLSDEAMLASRIQHPNVCATYEFGDERGIHYLVMEWSDGASLRDLLDAIPSHRIDPALAAHIVAAVASGLHAAHELTGEDGQSLGVVHRDVSPQNILISSGGHVRLADFGVAKARGQAHRPTETGEVKGKLAYMAPEQVASKGVDRRADVFALGCVLYEATLGRRPFHGSDALATMYKILEQEVVLPREHDVAFPETLEGVIVKALAKAPADRYQTADAFRQALVEYVASTRRYVADKQTAELLAATLGESLRERNRAIFEVGDRLRKGETDPARLRSPSPARQQRSVTPDGGIERTISALRQEQNEPKQSWSRMLIAGLLAAFAGVLLIGRHAVAPAPGAAAARQSELAPAAPQVLPAPQAVPLLAVALAPTAVNADPSVPGGSAPRVAASTVARPLGKASAVRAPSSGTPSGGTRANGAPKPVHAPRPIDRSNPFTTP